MDLDEDELKATRKANDKETLQLYERMIQLMAEEITSPINGASWIIQFYKDKAEKQLAIENQVSDMLE